MNMYDIEAEKYKDYRPKYPDSIFEYLASMTDSHNLAWDCATGNGQAAISLTNYYDRVFGSDISAEQIKYAQRSPKIDYQVRSCNKSGLPDNSVDLITVMTAAHWFEDLHAFQKECQRISKVGAKVAIISYSTPNFSISPIINNIFNEAYYCSLQQCYPKRVMENMRNFYYDLSLNLEQIATPSFQIEHDWNFNQFIKYLETFSCSRMFFQQNQYSLIEKLSPEIKKYWGNPEKTKKVTWPLFFKLYAL